MENIGLIALDGGNGIGGIITDGGVLNTLGDGGRIDITADTITADALSNTDISAQAYLGTGGGVNVTARTLLGIEFRAAPTIYSDITAFSTLGQSGAVDVQTENLDPTQGLATLPTEPRGPEAIQSCRVSNSEAASLVDHGRGGLLPRPEDQLTVDATVVEWIELGLADGVQANREMAVQPIALDPQLIATCGVDDE